MTKKLMLVEQTDVSDLKGNLKVLVDTVGSLHDEIHRKNSHKSVHNTLLTLSEACQYLRISRSTALRWIKLDVLEAEKAGRKYKIRQANLDKVLTKINTNNIKGYEYK